MSMCLVVCTAIFALGMIFTLPGALRRRGLAVWLVRRGSHKDIRCAPAMRGGTGIQWSASRGDLCESDQVGRTTATGFDNEPWRHVSNIVSTSVFLLVAFGAPRSQAPGVCREANTRGILSGKWQQCFAWRACSTGVAMMKFPAGLDDECADALLILFAAIMEI